MQDVAGYGKLSDSEELVGALTGGDGPTKSIYFPIHQPSHYFIILK